MPIKSTKKSIPVFPAYKKLELSDKKDIELIAKKFAPYSDYNFVSLWVYNTENDFQISKLHDNLVIRFRDYITNEPFYSFLGNSEILSTIKILLNYVQSKKIPSILKLIPESNLSGNKAIFDKFLITEDRDNFDYILSIAEFCNLEGEKYKSHRKVINRFNNRYSNCNAKLLNLVDLEIQNQIIELFFVWEKEKEKKRDETIHELTAIKRIFADPKYLNLLAMGLYHNNNLISFQIVDVINSKYVDSHFFKADPKYDGASHALRYAFSHELKKLGYEYINIEQDLGITGLRNKKASWKPITFLKKYTITM